MQKFKAIFFDWDGTAVLSRTAPAHPVIHAMYPLLEQGVQLVVISGTSYGNIAGGGLAEHFAPSCRTGLYLGLGRGAHNYSFTPDGKTTMLDGIVPDRATLLTLHRVCFQLHTHLFERYGYNTDIVFSRENYCKIDLGPNIARGDQLFFRGEELGQINRHLADCGYQDGISGLIQLAAELGKQNDLAVQSTTDAKFLEVGLGTKSDNVDTILQHLMDTCGIQPAECCFWGDEFLKMDEGIYGSDSFMITHQTKDCAFFDVSDVDGQRPAQVEQLGGGVERFLAFLRDQAVL